MHRNYTTQKILALMKKLFYTQSAFIILCLTWFSAALSAQIPNGYYNTATGTGSTLKTQLYNIVRNHTVRSYDQLWTDFQTTDDKADGKVWDMYSNCTFTFITDQCGNYSNECDCYNREHSLPQSWFNSASPMVSDLFHIVPTDGKVNGMRSNYPFGETTSPTYTSGNGSKLGPCSFPGYTGIVFEPIDEYKGDFAREYFYMATRYENIIATWYNNGTEADAALQNNAYPVFENWFLNLLGEWHSSDPVSQKETDRNNAIYLLQNNRNPFIDHPEYVYSVWGVGATISPEPGNYPTEFSAHCITLNWTDAGGAVSPTGYLLRMSSSGFNDISNPTDGITVSNDTFNKNTGSGVESCIFGSLSPGTVYYFKIFGYTGSGVSIDYKTDGSVMQTSIMAQ